jgi:hypothetical protein
MINELTVLTTQRFPTAIDNLHKLTQINRNLAYVNTTMTNDPSEILLPSSSLIISISHFFLAKQNLPWGEGDQ